MNRLLRSLFGSSQRNILRAGDSLKPGQSLVSPNALYTFILQEDGNLVLYAHEQGPVWATGTYGRLVSHAIMQNDGNFVLYHHENPVWATGTEGNPGAWFTLQDDRNLVVYSQENKPLWSANVYVRGGTDAPEVKHFAELADQLEQERRQREAERQRHEIAELERREREERERPARLEAERIAREEKERQFRELDHTVREVLQDYLRVLKVSSSVNFYGDGTRRWMCDQREVHYVEPGVLSLLKCAHRDQVGQVLSDKTGCTVIVTKEVVAGKWYFGGKTRYDMRTVIDATYESRKG